MTSAIAPWFLIIWAYTSHGFRSDMVPMATSAICQSEGHRLTYELGWAQNWDGFQCVRSGYEEAHKL
jgi:hypothetical protein